MIEYQELIYLLKDIRVIKENGKINSRYRQIFDKHKTIYNLFIKYTSFLQHKNPSFHERLTCIRLGITSHPECIECSKPTKFTINSGTYYFSEFCSNSCRYKSEKIKACTSRTNIHKYGGKAPIHNEDVKNKIIQTNIEKYGHSSPLYNEDVKNKIIQTNIEKYGVDNPFKSANIQTRAQTIKALKYTTEELRERQKKGCMDKYGVDNPLSCPEVRSKIHDTCKEKYNSISPLGNHNIRKQIIETWKTNYEGLDNPMKHISTQTRARQATFEKYGTEFHNQRHMKEILPLLEDKEWLLEEHHNKKLSLLEISYNLKIDHTTVSNYIKKHNIEVRYYNYSLGHKQLSTFLNENTLFDIVDNDRTIISPKELDIVIPEKKMAIEYCGLYWHHDGHDRITKNYHLDKLKQCQQAGYRLLTIFEDEWNDKQEIVKQKLLSLLGVDNKQPVYARNCTIVSVDKKEAIQFLNDYHIQGYGNPRTPVIYGLQYDGELVAVMVFGYENLKNGSKNNKIYELDRYATRTRVVGGFSKLLKYFCNNHTFDKIKTFADLRWSEGRLYEISGFDAVDVLTPDYFYVISGKRVFKSAYRHKGMRSKFEKGELQFYDPTLSETKNMELNGIPRIYDCGKIKYELTK